MPATRSLNDEVHHMAGALGKLTNLEGFVRQEIKLHIGIWSGLINFVPPALVASPVQSEIPDHERSDPD
nr:hypothetical protein [Tanacetum cinerariifolium]